MAEVTKSVLHKKKGFLLWPIQSGFKTSNDYVDIIKNKLKFLLAVKEGERDPIKPYGTDLWTYVFSNFNTAEIESLRVSLIDAINTWIPEMVIDNIDLIPTEEENNTLIIRVDFTLPAFNEHSDTLVIGV